MNRDIKFRVWDISYKKWINEWDDFASLFVYQFNDKNPFRTFNLGRDKERFISQQFTGLKDKNNKEIYEGDIISFSEHFAASALYSVPDQIVADKWIKKHSEVKFYNGSWVINPERFSTLMGRQSKLAEVISQEVEVAGNIFENQELLKNV